MRIRERVAINLFVRMGAVFIDNSQLTINIYTTMEEFWKKMRDDLKYEGFTTKEFWIYGVLVPLCLIAIMALAGAIESA